MHYRWPILALGARLDFPAQLMGEQLHAVADPEDWLAGVQHVSRNERRARLVHAGWATRQDEAARLQRSHALFGRVVRNQLAVDVVLADAPRDELAVLRAEIYDRDGVPFNGLTKRQRGLRCARFRRLCLGDLEVRTYLNIIRGRYAV